MDFPANSHNQDLPKEVNKPKKKEVEKVVSGAVTVRKKPLGRKFHDVFFGGESKMALRYISSEVLLPAFRNMIVDATSKGIERIVYGDAAPRRPRSYSDRPGPRYSYNAPVNRNLRERAPSPRGGRVTERKDIGEFLLVSREEADIVLERMTDIADQYDVVSVADLYELLDLPTTHVDQKWGWSGLHDASVRQTREGYIIDLPDAEPL